MKSKSIIALLFLSIIIINQVTNQNVRNDIEEFGETIGAVSWEKNTDKTEYTLFNFGSTRIGIVPYVKYNDPKPGSDLSMNGPFGDLNKSIMNNLDTQHIFMSLGMVMLVFTLWVCWIKRYSFIGFILGIGYIGLMFTGLATLSVWTDTLFTLFGLLATAAILNTKFVGYHNSLFRNKQAK
ncbi:hypothetical protein RJG79_07690 [Mycoplasmatota bacterium WC44]